MSDPCRDAFNAWWKMQPWTSPKRKEAALEAWLQAWITRPSRPLSVVSVPTVEEIHVHYRQAKLKKGKELGKKSIEVSSPEHIAGLEAIHALLIAQPPKDKPDD